MDEGGNDGQLLLHAVGIGGDGLGQIGGEPEPFGVFPDTAFPFLLGNTEHIGDKIEVLDAVEELVKIGVIGQVGDLLLAADGVLPNGDAVYIDLALLKLQDAAAGFDGGGFTGAVVPDKAVDLPCPDVQADIVNCFFLPVYLRQMFDFEHSASSDRMIDYVSILHYRFCTVNARGAELKVS